MRNVKVSYVTHFNKLRAWELIYAKVCVLDTDTLFARNADELLRLPSPTALVRAGVCAGGGHRKHERGPASQITPLKRVMEMMRQMEAADGNQVHTLASSNDWLRGGDVVNVDVVSICGQTSMWST